jgi:hypothetical protein
MNSQGLFAAVSLEPMRVDFGVSRSTSE